MIAAQIPSISFALFKDEKLQRAVSFGYSNPLINEAATPTTKFRLGSISKVLTSAAIFSLIDQGVFKQNYEILNKTLFSIRTLTAFSIYEFSLMIRYSFDQK